MWLVRWMAGWFSGVSGTSGVSGSSGASGRELAACATTIAPQGLL